MSSGGVRYVGDGSYLPGVPARDLTAEEWARVAADRRKRALRLGLYEEITDAAKPAKEK